MADGAVIRLDSGKMSETIKLIENQLNIVKSFAQLHSQAN